MLIISLEGGIAVGKSETLRAVQDLGLSDVECFLEPVQDWESVGGLNLLQRHYDGLELDDAKEKGERVFALQMYILSSMAKRLIRVLQSRANIAIVERSIQSARIFIELNKSHMSPEQYTVAKETCANLMKVETDPDTTKCSFAKVYLIPKNCAVEERVKKRGRSSERRLNLDYALAVHEKFKEEARRKALPILVNGEPKELGWKLYRIAKTMYAAMHLNASLHSVRLHQGPLSQTHDDNRRRADRRNDDNDDDDDDADNNSSGKQRKPTP